MVGNAEEIIGDMIENPSRRGFISTTFGAGALLVAAPKLILSNVPTLWGDGQHDDTDGLQALLDGKPFRIHGREQFAPGVNPSLTGGKFLLGRTVFLRHPTRMTNSHLIASPGFRGEVVLFITDVAADSELRSSLIGNVFDCKGLSAAVGL